MPMHELVKQLAQLQRQREALRAKVAKATNDLADIDDAMKRVAGELTETDGKTEGTERG